MYCPKCSQQQINDDVRFCSRCGFQMHVVSRLLETNGVLAGFETETTEKISLYKRVTSSLGAKVIFVSIVVFIFAFLFALANDVPEVLVLPFLLFVIGTAMLIYRLIFGDKNQALTNENSYQTKSMNRAESPNALPPMQSIPVSDYESPRRETNEFRQPPPSVTEPTTKLLEIDSEKKDF